MSIGENRNPSVYCSSGGPQHCIINSVLSPEFRRCAGTLSCRATCRENKLRTGDHYRSFAWFIAAILIAIAAYYVPRDSAVLREQVQKRAQEQAG